MSDKAEDLAFGRWPDILTARGMDSAFFSGRNGPCPFCGGKDRYRWTQKKYGGVWVCSAGCTGGKYASGFAMLMRHMGFTTFREAADDVRDYFGCNPSVEPIPRLQRLAMSNEMTPERIQRNRARMLKFWNEACEVTYGDPVDKYMQNRVRGMDFMPKCIRFHPALQYWMPGKSANDRPVLLGEYPAMLAYAQGPTGELVQLHKTYLTADGQKADVPVAKKTDLGVGVNSFAVRMMEMRGDTLGVCEGIETGWASAMLKNIPIWPCLNGPALAAFEVPGDLSAQVRTLIIFADSDELKPSGSTQSGGTKWKRAGSEYADKLAERSRARNLRTMIVRPAKVGHDMANYWSARIAA